MDFMNFKKLSQKAKALHKQSQSQFKKNNSMKRLSYFFMLSNPFMTQHEKKL